MSLKWSLLFSGYLCSIVIEPTPVDGSLRCSCFPYYKCCLMNILVCPTAYISG